MRIGVLLSGLFFSVLSFAHFEIGTYEGRTAANQICSFEIKSVSFENNLAHPLNERVVIAIPSLGDLVFTHIAIIDPANKTVRPKSHILSAVIPNSTGATSFELFMNHDGPVKMQKLVDHYKAAQENSLEECANLEFQK